MACWGKGWGEGNGGPQAVRGQDREKSPAQPSSKLHTGSTVSGVQLDVPTCQGEGGTDGQMGARSQES